MFLFVSLQWSAFIYLLILLFSHQLSFNVTQHSAWQLLQYTRISDYPGCTVPNLRKYRAAQLRDVNFIVRHFCYLQIPSENSKTFQSKSHENCWLPRIVAPRIYAKILQPHRTLSWVLSSQVSHWHVARTNCLVNNRCAMVLASQIYLQLWINSAKFTDNETLIFQIELCIYEHQQFSAVPGTEWYDVVR